MKDIDRLFAAAASGNVQEATEALDKIELLYASLLSEKASINTANAEGYMPIHVAAFHGRNEVVELLLKRGAYIDALDQAGRSPLMMAAKVATVRLLIYYGADPNAKAKNGNMAIHIAALQGWDDVVKFWAIWLKDEHLSVDVPNQSGRSPLMMATKVAIVELLIYYGADPNAKAKNGNMAIHIAALHGWNDVVKFWAIWLKDKHLSVDIKGHMERTALMQTPYPTTAQLLMGEGADPNAEDKLGYKAIHIAAWGGYIEMVGFWVDEQHVPVNTAARDGCTALEMASNPQTVKLLAALGAKGMRPDGYRERKSIRI